MRCRHQGAGRAKDTTNPDLIIKTTGYQWKWGYDYLRASEGCHSSPRSL